MFGEGCRVRMASRVPDGGKESKWDEKERKEMQGM